MNHVISDYTKKLKTAIECLTQEYLDNIAYQIFETQKIGGTVYICGNGGSASTASHMVCDLTKNTGKQIKAVCLSDNIASITAYANDVDYDAIFSEQLARMLQKNDMLIAISTSGNSMNVVNAVEVAMTFGVPVVFLLGPSLASQLALLWAEYEKSSGIMVNSDNIGVLEDAHLIINHILTELIREI